MIIVGDVNVDLLNIPPTIVLHEVVSSNNLSEFHTIHTPFLTQFLLLLILKFVNQVLWKWNRPLVTIRQPILRLDRILIVIMLINVKMDVQRCGLHKIKFVDYRVIEINIFMSSI